MFSSRHKASHFELQSVKRKHDQVQVVTLEREMRMVGAQILLADATLSLGKAKQRGFKPASCLSRIYPAAQLK